MPYSASTIARLQAGIDPTPTPSGCRLWTRSTTTNGYGQIIVTMPGESPRPRQAHRMMKEVELGRLLARDEYVLHSCDTPLCCAAEHTRVGTAQDNMNDKVARGRCNVPRGEAHNRAKLTEEQVNEIRRRWRVEPRGYGRWCGPGLTVTQLSREYGLSVNAMIQIVEGQTWRHLNV